MHAVAMLVLAHYAVLFTTVNCTAQANMRQLSVLLHSSSCKRCTYFTCVVSADDDQFLEEKSMLVDTLLRLPNMEVPGAGVAPAAAALGEALGTEGSPPA